MVTLEQGLYLTTEFAFAGRRWKLILLPSDLFMASQESQASLMVLSVGLCLTILLVICLVNRQKYIEKIESGFLRETAAKAQLTESEELHRTTIENISDTVLITDDQGEFKYICPNIKVIFGLTPEEVVSLGNIGALLGGPVFDPDELTIKSELHNIETTVTNRHGQEHFLLVSVKKVSIKAGTILYTCRDISDRKQAERALQRSVERFDLAMKFVNDGLFDWSLETNQIHYSPAWKRQLGYDDHEIKNELSEWERLTRREDAKASWSMLNDVIEGKRPRFELEYRMKHKNGSWVDLLSRANVVFDKNGKAVRVVGTHVDISERKRAEVSLKESEALFRAVFEQAGGYCMILKPDETGIPTILDANEAACETHGYTRDEMLGKPVADLDDEEGKKLCIERTEAIMSGKPLIVETNHVRKDGSTFPVAVYANMIRFTNKSPLIVTTEFDISDIKKGETEKFLLEKQLQHAQKLESIGNLAGGIAHDFNNLLSPIIGMAEMLLEDLPPDSLEYDNAREIFNAGKRAGDLVKQILAFSRQTEHKRLPVRVQTVLKEALKLSRSTIPANIEIRQEIQMDCALVMADETQLHQVAMNLITNAFHAVEEKNGTIVVDLKEVTLGNSEPAGNSLESGEYVALSISDNGHGISRDVINKVFEPYFTTKKKFKGTGLGLAVVYGIVKNHKGDIKVHSEEGKGTTFKVYLPLMKKDAVTAFDERALELKPGTEKILLVDDEESVVGFEKQMLQRLGYQVTERTSSVDAFREFATNPDSFDLVISDMTMPNMTGDQLARKLISIRPDIPIIICTGFSERVSEEQAMMMGIKGFLMKPVFKAQMAQMVRKVLDEANDKI